ncbi:hypothetical protein [Gilvimarinus sp. DA14]|uniref:hypothetical protein n=1 Tax=Gilvimarinus sp. DA14 TaxID=2956798 RepID=UPI0020B8FEE4|nr:hypothetical protein [Gilvimarinus sp. DA14]UTF59940.1 hypothetical protein NHM04_15920 [Gilvimarinus sp. DA14]
MTQRPIQPRSKALEVNLDASRYGSFAEIGAGQEVVRWFFQAGGAAGTIAKSISAYDMKVSDAIYGKCARYVCRERLEAMLRYEYDLNLERLSTDRGESTAFFSFADTVSARNFHGTNECHGWLGIRFQASPLAPPSEIIIHVRMLDNENSLQQEALGIVGVNLIYGACFLSDDPEKLVKSLLDGLSTDRIEIDMVEFVGDAFAEVDNRIISLRLVQLGLSGAAMFAADGSVLQPSEHLRKRPLLVERGRFRPVTHVNLDMLNAALQDFENEEDIEPGETLAIMEITMNNLHTGDEIDLQDFISRAEVLEATGYTVLISDFPEYYRLAAYLARYTNRRIGLTMGAHSLCELFQEHYYDHLAGGILEGFGRLFKNNLKLYIYPFKDPETGTLAKVNNLRVPEKQSPLYDYLVNRGCIAQIEGYNEEYLSIFSPDVLKKIVCHQPGWETMVPKVVAKKIQDNNLFQHAVKCDTD